MSLEKTKPALLCALLLSSACLDAADQGPASPPNVTGQLSDAATGDPASSVRVDALTGASPRARRLVESALSDDEGAFALTLPLGTYTVRPAVAPTGLCRSEPAEVLLPVDDPDATFELDFVIDLGPCD